MLRISFGLGLRRELRVGVYYGPVGGVGKRSAYGYDEEVAEWFWAWTEKELEEWVIG